MRGWPCLALASALSLLAMPLASRAATPAAAASTATVAPARDQALQAFQRDLVNLLALRATAQPLLGAALLARPLANPPKGSSFHALIVRAAAATDAGPAEQWLRLADCDARADACPNRDAQDKLMALAPDNAAVWLLKLGQDSRDLHADAARADLAKAASARLYDDYAGASLTALAAVVDTLPPPPAVLGEAGVHGVQALIVLGNARLQPRPVLPMVASLCRHAGKDAAIKADCLKLGKLLSWGSSPLARSLGLHLLEALGEPAQQAAAREQRRDLAWQVHNYSQLALRAQHDAALAQRLLGIARQGGNEMSQMTAMLRASGVATTAPGSWQPAAPRDAPAPAHSP